jgi:hypothetical protein
MGKKIAGLTYVDEFSFPSEQGFSGSAGKQSVKGYMRGGHVKDHVKKAAQKHRAPGPGAARGGTVGVTTERGPKSRRQKSTMTKAAHGGSMHDQLYAAGDEMGYKRGGQVKNTSAEFVQQSRAQDPMDSGVQPARKGRNQADIEAGGTKRLKPKMGYGGSVHSVRDRPAKRRAKSGRGMPKGVKARGGLMEYAQGGSVPPSVGHLGQGAAANAARATRKREMKIDETAQEAIRASRASMISGTATQDRPPKPAAKRPASRAPAPGSQRGKRPHYGLPFKSTPMVK